MASTYSDLKIELIGTGEQVGTWGATTNTNLGTALEEAIVGSANVSFSSSDVTLTLTNTNGTQAARHLRLNLTGTSGGARNLILGSGCQIDKPYIINNGLADTVTVKNTTGTGVAVPAGKTMWVFNNGTNVVEAMNHASSLTLGTALPAASGGTGLTSPGASGNVLTSNGTTWTSAAGGNVVGPASSTDNAVVRFDGTTGKLLQNSAVTIADTSGNITTSGVVLTANGTVSAPSFSASGDTNTGIYFPASDQLAVSLGGVRSILFTGNGAVLETSSIPLTINSTNSNAYKIGFQNNGVARGFVGASSANAFMVANGSSTDVLNVTSAGVLQMNSGYGSVASAFGVRAWANFTGGNPTSQVTSGGVSSITYGGATGVFAVSFSSTMPDTGYAVVTANYYSAGNNPFHSAIQTGTKTTSGFTLVVLQFGSPGGPTFFNTADTAFAVVR